MRNSNRDPTQILRTEQESRNNRYTRKVIITPTKIYFAGPQLELTNRIVRVHEKLADRFLRVTFSEEDFGSMGGNVERNEALFIRVEAILREGLRVEHYAYQFLHYSNR